MDGVMSHHGSPDDVMAVASTVSRQLVRATSRRDPKAFNVLHGYLLEHNALVYVDKFNEVLSEARGSRGDEVLAVGRHLLLRAADREAVKFAINLIGVLGGPEDHEKLLTIGSHDEFTLFAAVALGHSGGDIKTLWKLAQRVSGWGRVQCIARMDNEIGDPSMRRWLLTEGYRNTIMVEYTAAVCARRGRLAEALCAPEVDDGLIEGAGEMLAALARGNPGDGMEGYEQAAFACEKFQGLLEAHPAPKVDWLLADRDIEQFAQSGSEPVGGWSVDRRADYRDGSTRIRSQPRWGPLLVQALESPDDLAFNLAASAAPLVGIDPWEHRFRRLHAGGDQWYWLLETPDESRLRRVLDYAATHLDLKSIATGWGDELGLGPEFAEHRKLGWVLQALERWPEVGEQYLVAGMASPVVNNRWGAVRAAVRWPPDTREPLRRAMETGHRAEQREDLKVAFGRALAGETDLPEA